MRELQHAKIGTTTTTLDQTAQEILSAGALGFVLGFQALLHPEPQIRSDYGRVYILNLSPATKSCGIPEPLLDRASVQVCKGWVLATDTRHDSAFANACGVVFEALRYQRSKVGNELASFINPQGCTAFSTLPSSSLSTFTLIGILYPAAECIGILPSLLTLGDQQKQVATPCGSAVVDQPIVQTDKANACTRDAG